MPPAPGQEAVLKRMTKVVNSLLSKEESAPFREPVDWRGLELYDYPVIIEKMMDLGTIRRKLERGNYETAHQVAEDIRLVWKNCMTYNADGSDFWLLAKSFSRKFEDRYRKIKGEFDVGEDLYAEEDPAEEPAEEVEDDASGPSVPESSAPSVAESRSSSAQSALDVRARFGASLFLLSGFELGKVISRIELECPNALESWGDQKIEVNVDALPQKLFSSLQSFVYSKVGDQALLNAPQAEKPRKKRKSS